MRWGSEAAVSAAGSQAAAAAEDCCRRGVVFRVGAGCGCLWCGGCGLAELIELDAAAAEVRARRRDLKLLALAQMWADVAARRRLLASWWQENPAAVKRRER